MDKEHIVRLLHNNDKAVARALVALTERQTADEQATRHTRYRNGQGFRPCHARLGTNMAQFFQRHGYLSQSQLEYWREPQRDGRSRIEIYANQLLEIARERATDPSMKIIPVEARVVEEDQYNVDPELEQELARVQHDQTQSVRAIFAQMDTIRPELSHILEQA